MSTLQSRLSAPRASSTRCATNPSLTIQPQGDDAKCCGPQLLVHLGPVGRAALAAGDAAATAFVRKAHTALSDCKLRPSSAEPHRSECELRCRRRGGRARDRRFGGARPPQPGVRDQCRGERTAGVVRRRRRQRAEAGRVLQWGLGRHAPRSVRNFCRGIQQTSWL